MYKLFIDKPELFEATIQIEGASIENTLCRLTLQHKNCSLLFEGKIENNTAKIPVNSLKTFLKEGDTGILRLEVIADDVYFVPWESTYLADVSKKVTAEVKESKQLNSGVKITEVSVKSDINSLRNKFITELSNNFKKNNIAMISVKENINKIKRITKDINSKYLIKESDLLECVTQALKNIKI